MSPTRMETVRRWSSSSGTPGRTMCRSWTCPRSSPASSAQFPSEEDGFYPVIVTTGISDTENVEITSGVQEGDEVFVNFMVTDYSSGY